MRKSHHFHRFWAPWIFAVWMLLAIALATVQAQTYITDEGSSTNTPSKFRSPEDGWLDVSEFLEEKYGFLPLVVPITEPAVGYGAAGGLLFLSKPLPNAED